MDPLSWCLYLLGSSARIFIRIWCTSLAVVVDVDDIDSVTMAGTWKQDIVNNAVFTANSGNLQEDTKDSKQIPILLLGNKLDKVYKETGLYFG